MIGRCDFEVLPQPKKGMERHRTGWNATCNHVLNSGQQCGCLASACACQNCKHLVEWHAHRTALCRVEPPHTHASCGLFCAWATLHHLSHVLTCELVQDVFLQIRCSMLQRYCSRLQ